MLSSKAVVHRRCSPSRLWCGRIESRPGHLRDGSNQLSSGADALYNGVLALNNGVPALVDGVSQLSAWQMPEKTFCCGMIKRNNLMFGKRCFSKSHPVLCRHRVLPCLGLYLFCWLPSESSLP